SRGKAGLMARVWSVRKVLVGGVLAARLAASGWGQSDGQSFEVARTQQAAAQKQSPEKCCDPAKSEGKANGQPEQQKRRPAELFAARARMILGSGQPAKGAWGLLICDGSTGQVLFEQDADKYFVPASNMKLLTTALALAKLGPEYRFRTTLEGTTEP